MSTTIDEFRALSSLTDLAKFLGFEPKVLSYVLYKLNGGPSGQYFEFTIKKRTGGVREIATPNTVLKTIQKSLTEKLYEIYMVKKSVHGFVRERTILTNANVHSRKKYVFNIDLKDFFHSIHFGRIVGLLTARPYTIDRKIAILIAKIACYNDRLPQGAPCSPVISNMVCAYLDRQLCDLAKTTGCYYTRYADDITFSTNRFAFPNEIAIKVGHAWGVGSVLEETVNRNGFAINGKKTSLRSRSDRQMVTGLIVNDYPNIQRKLLKQVRAMLHDWKVHGLEDAQGNFLSYYSLQNNRPRNGEALFFDKVVRGKIEYIRQIRSHRIDLLNETEKHEATKSRVRQPKREFYTIFRDQYYKYFERYEQLVIRDCGMPTILGEGQTDWMHFKSALSSFHKREEFSDLYLNIQKHKGYAPGGVSYLQSFCQDADHLYVKFEHPVICVFDCDIPKINQKHMETPDGYLYYGNNVYSIVLPAPAHRATTSFSVEQLYTDEDLLKADKFGRRIFLSTEFDEKTGELKANRSIKFGINARNGAEGSSKEALLGKEKVIDSAVCVMDNGKLKSLSQSKKDFAINIVRNETPFQNVNFDAFKPLFELIRRVCHRGDAPSPASFSSSTRTL
ncbi:MAG: reverse transcriptase domain-containing protein [Humidesulfovibrio sp.]|nr:reverse transcriptase domain-containing protein [Humidesulfovibrio sp.]